MAGEKKVRDLGPAGVAGIVKAMKAKGQKVGILKRVKNVPLPAKVGAGLGVGALIVFGTAALVPIGIGAAGLGGYYALKARKYSHSMTPERIKVYEQAIGTLKDPAKLRSLADEFEKAGCAKEAEHLRKRAALRERSPEEKSADQQRYRQAMANTDRKQVEAEASYFQSIGADGAAKNLRTRAEALKAVA